MLTQFPSKYVPGEREWRRTWTTTASRTSPGCLWRCGSPVAETKIEIKPRGKKFVSLWVTRHVYWARWSPRHCESRQGGCAGHDVLVSGTRGAGDEGE